MRQRVLLRVAAVAVALVMSGSAVAVADTGGNNNSGSACPTHKHHGEHNGVSSGKNSQNKGSTHGKKCGDQGTIT